MDMPMNRVEWMSIEEIARELTGHRAELAELEAHAEGREAADLFHEHVLRDRIEALESEVARRDEVYLHAEGPNSASNALAAAQAAMGG